MDQQLYKQLCLSVCQSAVCQSLCCSCASRKECIGELHLQFSFSRKTKNNVLWSQMNFRITCGMTKGQNKKLCVSEIFLRVLSSGSFTLSCCYLFLSGGPATRVSLSARARERRSQEASQAGRKGGRERKQKIILVCTFCLKGFMTIRLFVFTKYISYL